MPGLNGTGPMGDGQQTGRGLGACKGSQNFVNQNMNTRPAGRGNGRGRGFGGGQGFGRGCHFGRTDMQLSDRDEQQELEKQKEILQNQLNNVNQMLNKFETKETTDK